MMDMGSLQLDHPRSASPDHMLIRSALFNLSLSFYNKQSTIESKFTTQYLQSISGLRYFASHEIEAR